MGIPFHTLYATDGLENFNVADRIYFGTIDVTYAGGANTATAAVTWTEPVPSASTTPYTVLVSLPENAIAWATSQTTLGFTLNVQRLSGNLAGGIAGCVIIA